MGQKDDLTQIAPIRTGRLFTFRVFRVFRGPFTEHWREPSVFICLRAAKISCWRNSLTR